MHKLVLALAASALLASAAHAADQKRSSGPLPSGTMRVAVINLGAVIGGYEKANEFKNDLAGRMKKLQEEAKKLQLDLARWQTALQKDDLVEGTKEQYEEKVIDARRRLEDLGRQANVKVGKTQQAHLESLWRDVEEAVRSYCADQKIDLVIAYGDPVKKDDAANFLNIDRKVRAIDQGGSVPFFVAPGVDISSAVIERLNKTYREEQSRSQR